MNKVETYNRLQMSEILKCKLIKAVCNRPFVFENIDAPKGSLNGCCGIGEIGGCPEAEDSIHFRLKSEGIDNYIVETPQRDTVVGKSNGVEIFVQRGIPHGPIYIGQAGGED